jgi:hypothetical protein
MPGLKPLPLWVRALDAASVIALFLTAFVLLAGGLTVHVSLTPLRLNSPLKVLFVAAALIAVRHTAFPGLPLHRRLADSMRGAARPTLAAAGVALASRLAVLFVGFLAVATIGVDQSVAPFQVSSDKLMNLPARFDAGWYGDIALDGYSFAGAFDRQQNLAFFPAFPMAMRVAGYAMGAYGRGMPRELRMARLLWGGVLVSLAAFAWASVYLWRLARDTIGETRAGDAVALLAAYPFALFYSAPYSESVFLLGSIAAVYHFRRDEWLRAGGWGCLAGLARPNGCFLSVVLAALLIERHLSASRQAVARESAAATIPTSLLSAAMPALGMLAFSAYVHHVTGAFFGWARLHEAWGRTYQGLAPLGQVSGRIGDTGLLQAIGAAPFDALNALGLTFALLMVWPVARRLGPAMALFILVNAIPPVLAGGVMSIGRLTATLFPAFVTLAALAPPRVVTALVTMFAIGQGLAAALFFTWRPLF